MLDLKSIYFYFLAIQISTIKFLKKIYFTTKFYNNSLRSIIPKQFYFNPNSFLLSSFTGHENFSFDISNREPEKFWINDTHSQDNENLHNFLWLNLIDRKNDGSSLRRIISLWIVNNNNYKPDVWKSSILSMRIISWIINSDIILSGKNFSFKKEFMESIIKQTNHLKKNFKFETEELKKIENLTAILLSGLVFREYKENFDFANKELKKLVSNFFDDSGFPLTRNSNDLILFSKYFIIIKECIKDAQYYIPDFLEEIIEKNINCIKTITTSNYKMPLFNGATEINLENYYNYLLNLNFKIKKLKENIGGIQILKNKKDLVYFDTGQPPQKNYSYNYQCGPLSFEYYSEGEKIISNCGYGSGISRKAALLSRLTSAQSSLCINDTSVIKFERSKLLNKVFGNSLKGNFRVNSIDIFNNDFEVSVKASHNAYLKNFGYIHERKVKLNKENNSLSGTDRLVKKKDGVHQKFAIRFHLYPGISAVQTMGGENVLIHVNKNKSLVFSSNADALTIEKSIFLGGNKILNNLCITISGILMNKDKEINWEIKKNI